MFPTNIKATFLASHSGGQIFQFYSLTLIQEASLSVPLLNSHSGGKSFSSISYVLRLHSWVSGQVLRFQKGVGKVYRSEKRGVGARK